MARHPRRGEHGDPRPRCQWCGRPYDRGILDPTGEIPYCSFKCRMAGGFWMLMCAAIVSTMIVLTITNLFLESMASGGFVSLFLLPLGIFWFIDILMWIGVLVGYRVRSASAKQSELYTWEENS